MTSVALLVLLFGVMLLVVTAWVISITSRVEALEAAVARLTGQAGVGADPLRMGASAPAPAPPNPPAVVAGDGMAEVRELVRNGEKINAIVRYRALTGAGLKEAKDAVEVMEG